MCIASAAIRSIFICSATNVTTRCFSCSCTPTERGYSVSSRSKTQFSTCAKASRMLLSCLASVALVDAIMTPFNRWKSRRAHDLGSGRGFRQALDGAMGARLDVLDVEADIQRPDRMGQVADRNDVDAGLGDWHDGLFVDAARRF